MDHKNSYIHMYLELYNLLPHILHDICGLVHNNKRLAPHTLLHKLIHYHLVLRNNFVYNFVYIYQNYHNYMDIYILIHIYNLLLNIFFHLDIFSHKKIYVLHLHFHIYNLKMKIYHIFLHKNYLFYSLFFLIEIGHILLHIFYLRFCNLFFDHGNFLNKPVFFLLHHFHHDMKKVDYLNICKDHNTFYPQQINMVYQMDILLQFQEIDILYIHYYLMNYDIDKY